MLCILCIFLYVAVVFLLYPSGQGQKTSRDNPEPVRRSDNSDIMGKSTFNVNAELQRMRQQKEEKARKEAIAKGEMTEDGREIAQPVNPEDCEVEQKKVWAQVPTEQLADIFDEPDADVPVAKGDPLNDVDLMFGPKRRELDADEERKVSESMYNMFNDTLILDDLTDQVPAVAREIRRMIDKYKAEMTASKEHKDTGTSNIIQKRFSMEDRYADFLS